MIRHILPYTINKRLFGDRKRFGLLTDVDDSCWQEWQKTYEAFYYQNQKSGIGDVVNNLGYKVVKNHSFENKTILEAGPGEIRHIKHWHDKPNKYIVIDNQQHFLDTSKQVLQQHNINHQLMLSNLNTSIDIPDHSVDIILSFYALEHILSLDQLLVDMKRMLRPNGKLIGAIPTEGGLAWGMGRYITSRRWLLKNTTINPDKIICWEHPNFAVKIIKLLKKHFNKVHLSYYPFKLPVIDLNLVITFECE